LPEDETIVGSCLSLPVSSTQTRTATLFAWPTEVSCLESVAICAGAPAIGGVARIAADDGFWEVIGCVASALP
jgi:hypothetical protein